MAHVWPQRHGVKHVLCIGLALEFQIHLRSLVKGSFGVSNSNPRPKSIRCVRMTHDQYTPLMFLVFKLRLYLNGKTQPWGIASWSDHLLTATLGSDRLSVSIKMLAWDMARNMYLNPEMRNALYSELSHYPNCYTEKKTVLFLLMLSSISHSAIVSKLVVSAGSPEALIVLIVTHCCVTLLRSHNPTNSPLPLFLL